MLKNIIIKLKKNRYYIISNKMSNYTYTYNITLTFPDGFYSGQFDGLIRENTSLEPTYLGLNTSDNTLNVLFMTELSPTNLIIFNNIISSYVPVPPTPSVIYTPIFSTALRKNNGSQYIDNNKDAYIIALDFLYPGNSTTATGISIVAANDATTSTFLLQNYEQTITYGSFSPTLTSNSSNYTLTPLGVPNALPTVSTTLRFLFKNGGSGVVRLYSFTIC